VNVDAYVEEILLLVIMLLVPVAGWLIAKLKSRKMNTENWAHLFDVVSLHTVKATQIVMERKAPTKRKSLPGEKYVPEIHWDDQSNSHLKN